ncbi:MAG: T9SS type A sorting domain-containing protein [Chlorobi bacterium]|nr:T9SS type A sorting domain-containing protein [Chlorobiota bacterium]MCI0717267.1 T9SS type A sorting domain-containing protein [Chlorobiota bacterium]
MGHLFITGSSFGSGTNYDIVTIRYNPDSGDSVWVNRYDGSSNDDRVTSITCDNNAVYVTGWSFTPSRDIIVIKYDAATGSRLWVRTYNGTANGGDYGFAIAVDGSGNVYATGRSDVGGSQKFTTLKYDASGNLAAGWPSVYTAALSTSFDEAHAVKVDGSGNVYVTGKSGTPGDFLTLKLDAGGAVLWGKKHNGTQNAEDNALKLVLDNSSTNVYVGGYSFRQGFVQNYVVIRYSTATGDSSAFATYDNVQNIDILTDMKIDNSNNVFVTGYSTSATAFDYATLKYNSALSQQWVARTTNSGNDFATSLSVDNANGNVYVTGYSIGSGSGFDYLTVSYNSSGSLNWQVRVNGTANAGDFGAGVHASDTDHIYVTGNINTTANGVGIYTIRYSKILGITPISGEVPSSFALRQNFPNPFNPVTSIHFDIPKSSFVRISVYDIMGREVEVLANETVSAGKYEAKWDGSKYASGIYFYTLSAGDFLQTKKMVLAK